MAVAALRERPPLGNAGLLAEAGKRIIFAENRDDRTAFASLADHRGRQAGDSSGRLEALTLQHGGMGSRRAAFLIIQLGRAPDPIAELDEGFFLRLDEAPDIIDILHRFDQLHDAQLACGNSRLSFA